MARFNVGDRVVANKSIVATVHQYDEEIGRLTIVQDLPGGATNTISGPIQSYDLELLVAEAVTEAPADDESAAELEHDEESAKTADVFTTLDTLS